jgi:hypothetical protein
MANVNGNWKKRKPIQRNLSLKKIPGQGVRTHDVMKGISFKDKAYKWGASTRAGAQKGAGKIARSYRRYGKPTETIFRRVGSTALGVGKIALRFPGATLAATGLGLGAKALGKKWGRGYHYSAVRQFDKKGRKRI